MIKENHFKKKEISSKIEKWMTLFEGSVPMYKTLFGGTALYLGMKESGTVYKMNS